MTVQAQPEINISVNVNAKALCRRKDFEVELHLDAKAAQRGTVTVLKSTCSTPGVLRLEGFRRTCCTRSC